MSSRARTARLRPADRLRSSKDFQRLRRRSKRRRSAHFVALVGEGLDPTRSRLGLTVSRRVGDAVQRNAVKRQLREWFRTHRDRIPEGRDVVIIARPGAAEQSRGELQRELEELFP